MKTLTRHLNMVHTMKPGAYRKQFGIPSKQSLTARSLMYPDDNRHFHLVNCQEGG